MARLAAFSLVLGLSGLPILERMLCGVACTPAATQPAGCHEHGSSDGPVAALSSAHTCDHATEGAPAILQVAAGAAAAPMIAATLAAPASMLAIGTARPLLEVPPGAADLVSVPHRRVLRI